MLKVFKIKGLGEEEGKVWGKVRTKARTKMGNDTVTSYVTKTNQLSLDTSSLPGSSAPSAPNHLFSIKLVDHDKHIIRETVLLSAHRRTVSGTTKCFLLGSLPRPAVSCVKTTASAAKSNIRTSIHSVYPARSAAAGAGPVGVLGRLM